MTTGTWNVGNPTTSLYHSMKSWSGTDGRGKENPYEMTARTYKRSFAQSRGVWDLISNPPPVYGWRCIPSYNNRSPNCDIWQSTGWSTNEEIALLLKLAGQIRGHQFHLGVFAATAPQAYNQAISTVTNIGRSMVHLKRGNIPQALRTLGLTPGQRKVSQIQNLRSKDISSAWLAMQYGWLPTVSDAFEAAKAFEKLNEKRATTYTATHTKRRSYNSSASPSLYSCAAVGDVSVRLKYRLEEQLTAERELGLTDPVSIAWELLPWSFVVDWFLPVGDYFEALNLIPKLKGSWVRSDRYRHTGTGPSAVKQSADIACGGYGSVQQSTIWLGRTVGTTLSVPLPTFIPPQEAMSAARIKNAIALIHQKLR